MRRMTTTLGTLAGAALLAITLPSTAHAATGIFEYTTHDGVGDVLINPNDATCYNIDVGGRVANNTNREAVVYAGANCQGASTTLPARSKVPQLDGKSVKFVR